MSSDYMDVYAQCPYYIGCELLAHKWAMIKCEGIDVKEETVLKIQFQSKADRNEYKKKYCDKDYNSCLICQMNERKWEDVFRREQTAGKNIRK